MKKILLIILLCYSFNKLYSANWSRNTMKHCGFFSGLVSTYSLLIAGFENVDNGFSANCNFFLTVSASSLACFIIAVRRFDRNNHQVLVNQVNRIDPIELNSVVIQEVKGA